MFCFIIFSACFGDKHLIHFYLTKLIHESLVQPVNVFYVLGAKPILPHFFPRKKLRSRRVGTFLSKLRISSHRFGLSASQGITLEIDSKVRKSFI